MAHDKIELGEFTVGEIPLPLTYQFVNDDGSPLNLTGYTAEFQWAERDSATMFANGETRPATITDAANGMVQYAWSGDEFDTPGRYVGLFWVGDGTNRFASKLHTWSACLSPDDPPAI